MKHSAYPYIIAGALLLCAMLAVLFLLVLPGLTEVSEPLVCVPVEPDTPSAELEGAQLLALAFPEAKALRSDPQ